MNETIAQKLQYTSNAVDDIQRALNEKGVEVDNTVELGLYGDKIREINSEKGTHVSPVRDWYPIGKIDMFNFILSKTKMESIEEVTDINVITNIAS